MDDGARFLLWFDTEYSSIDIDRAAILQAALVVTDPTLRPVRPDEAFVRDVRASAGLRAVEARRHGLSLWMAIPQGVELSPFVRNQPGLLDACRTVGRAAEEVDRILAGWVDAIAGPPREREKRPILAGNSVHLDWFLARRHLPEFCGRLHYRLLDVTAHKIEWKGFRGGARFDKDSAAEVARWFPDADLGPAESRHDAYYDVLASIAELSYYRAGLARA